VCLERFDDTGRPEGLAGEAIGEHDAAPSMNDVSRQMNDVSLQPAFDF
jgi:hypothetical protein